MYFRHSNFNLKQVFEKNSQEKYLLILINFILKHLIDLFVT
jgi:hypothetical protein